MTDPRARRERAIELLNALPVIFTVSQYGSVPLCKEAEAECLETIKKALADAERRGMERAAGIARDHECDIGCICRIEIALKLRAQAQADKEG